MAHRPPRDVQIRPPDPKRRRSILHASSPSGIWTSWTVVGVKPLFYSFREKYRAGGSIIKRMERLSSMGSVL
ncbi:hypothetical protein KP509_04G062100 [Ceratopteris richardii]|uniref:Uncharacterized protein n=1 Tax=Ceratopteris richardii TaxID=49495 RepID=A0A8T2UXK7_CERRI|nr:hypothetical protein KP509_04G062100 [Ceratopteris richardii]